MTKNRISTAIEIIELAIKNNSSIRKECVEYGHSSTYVKNVKKIVITNKSLYPDDFDRFMNVYQKYLKLVNDRKLGNNVLTEHDDNSSESNSDETGEKLSINSTNNNKATIEWKVGDNYPVDHIKTLDQLLLAAKVDKDVWKVKNYVVNKWDVTSWRNNIPRTIQNFQVKANLERLEEVFKFKKAADIFADMTKNYEVPKVKYVCNDQLIVSDNLLEISIFDLHIGKLAWAGETGENYDIKIATERFITSINTLLKRAKLFSFSRILFPVGSDFFNSDNMNCTTTAGTPQDEDMRWQKTFKLGVKLLVDGINILKSMNVPVDVIVIPGNHDFEKSYYMGSYLEAWFNDDSQVTINNSASPRKYYNFGNVLLGFTHGNEEKESSLPLIMASDIESKKIWSNTIFHEWHIGHQHRKKKVNFNVSLDENLGVTVRYLSSLTGTEEWHHKKGYVGTIKAADAFIWNCDDGLIAELTTNFIK